MTESEPNERTEKAMERILVYGMTDNLGGIETYIMMLYRRMDKTRMIFDFVTDFPSMTFADEVSRAGSRIYYMPAKGKDLKGHLREMNRLLKEHPEYKAVYFNIVDAGAAVTMSAAWRQKRRVIAHAHNSSSGNQTLQNICRPLLGVFAGRWLACSRTAARFMFGERTAQKAEIIPNLIDAKRFAYDPELRQRTRKELGLQDEDFALIHVGRLDWEKNPKELLEIFRGIRVREPRARLLSIGSGPMEGEVHQYARQLGIDESVGFLGRQEDIVPYLQAADVFVLPSVYEGFGIVAVLAQAAGLPCVLSTGVPEDVKVTENVEYLPVQEHERWTEAVLKFRNMPRACTTEQIISAGYDISRVPQVIGMLEDFFGIGSEKGQ